MAQGISRATEAWPDIELIDDRRGNQFKAVIRRPCAGEMPRISLTDIRGLGSSITQQAKAIADHLASSHCTEFISFDDRRFARLAKRLGVTPEVVVPAK
jgi:hypothetical protein